MAEMTKEKATDRIRKLLNLANNAGATEGERDTAMQMAMNMLARHNLAMADFADPSVPQEKRGTEKSEHFPDPWRRRVAGAISRMFFCEYFYQSMREKQKNLFTFVGKESNATTAKEMTDWLVKAIAKEATKKQKENGGGHAFATSFQNAASIQIERRCQEMRNKAEVETKPVSGGTSLVLSNIYKQEEEANLEFIMKDLGISLKTKTLKTKLIDAAGAAAGHEYGKNVSLNTQIKGSSGTPRAAIK